MLEISFRRVDEIKGSKEHAPNLFKPYFASSWVVFVPCFFDDYLRAWLVIEEGGKCEMICKIMKKEMLKKKRGEKNTKCDIQCEEKKRSTRSASLSVVGSLL